MRRYQNKKHFKIRKRAVVRTIDFLVSFTLFIILLTQFYLIIINMNLNLSTISTTEENPAQLFSDKILSSPGTKDWGILSGIPQNIGLAPDQSHTGFNYYLDLAKFAHLNSELQYLSINSSYSYITPSILLSNLTGSQTNVQFRISTRPIIQVQTSETHTGTSATISVKTLTWSNLSIPNVDIEFYLVNLATNTYSNNLTSTTGMNGQTSIPATIGSNNYLAVVFAHSQDTWGINWVPINNAPSTTMSATDISSFSLNNPDLTSNTILQYAYTALSGSNIQSTTAYYSMSKNYLNFTSVSGTSPFSINATNVGTDTPYIQVYSMVSGSTYYYRVVTQPLIFNNANFVSPTTANNTSSQFPVYQTPNFQTSNSGTIYTYSTPVMTQRGPVLFTVDYSSS